MFYQYGILLFTIVSVTSALPSVDTGCTCQRIKAPVCGSDGKTYNNECLFNCARTVNTELIVQNYGRCGEKECFCNYDYSPVCGTDGRTYGNECSLRCLKKKSPQLDVKHTGKCNTQKRMYDDVIQEDEETQVAESPKDFVKIANPNTDNVDQECFCNYDYSPVCGTDGRTYGNVCSLRCLKKKSPQLEVKHTGKCNTQKRMYDEVTRDEEVRDTRAESPKDIAKVANPNTVNVAQSQEIKNCNCPTKFKPVCGTNGVTYTNNCHLDCASQKNGGGIHVFRRGSCNSMTNGVQVRCTSCSLKISEPVCGKNGVTYANPCLMRCAGVQMASPGVCEMLLPQIHSVQPIQAKYYSGKPYYY